MVLEERHEQQHIKNNLKGHYLIFYWRTRYVYWLFGWRVPLACCGRKENVLEHFRSALVLSHFFWVVSPAWCEVGTQHIPSSLSLSLCARFFFMFNCDKRPSGSAETISSTTRSAALRLCSTLRGGCEMRSQLDSGEPAGNLQQAQLAPEWQRPPWPHDVKGQSIKVYSHNETRRVSVDIDDGVAKTSPPHGASRRWRRLGIPRGYRLNTGIFYSFVSHDHCCLAFVIAYAFGDNCL